MKPTYIYLHIANNSLLEIFSDKQRHNFELYKLPQRELND